MKCEPGAIAFCSEGIAVDTAMDGGLFRSLSRVVAGESLFTNTLTNAVRACCGCVLRARELAPRMHA